MGFFGIGGDSKSSQSTTQVSDQGQFNKGSQVLQGGSKGAVGKGAKLVEAGGTDNSGAKFTNTQNLKQAKGASYTVNNTNTGISTDTLGTILGAITGAGASPPPAYFNPAPSTPSPSAPAPAATTPDATTGTAFDWSKYYWVGGVIAAIFVLKFLFGKR